MQGALDDNVLPAVQEKFARTYRAAGGSCQYGAVRRIGRRMGRRARATDRSGERDGQGVHRQTAEGVVRASFKTLADQVHPGRTISGHRVTPPIRFRFADFVISPRQRLLLRDGQVVPLIPKYFDLLHLLIVRRQDAVAKDVIFAEVWSDVVVTDGALSQAVRTLRRTLTDDVREPKFIRTVSRHGYQFVWPEVIEEADDGRVGSAGNGERSADGAPAGMAVEWQRWPRARRRQASTSQLVARR